MKNKNYRIKEKEKFNDLQNAYDIKYLKKEDPKQKNYAVKFNINDSEYMYQIYEDGILYSSHSKQETANKICKYLNALEKSK